MGKNLGNGSKLKTIVKRCSRPSTVRGNRSIIQTETQNPRDF